MNCPNCGAAMALIESRRHFQCRHCGTFEFPRPLDADGIRIVGPAPDARGRDRGSRHVPRVDESYVRQSHRRAAEPEADEPLAALFKVLFSG